MLSKTWVEISKQNLLHNVEQFLSLLKPETYFMAVVKSNAYGHGLREVAQILSHGNFTKLSFVTNNKAKLLLWFGVDNLDEARVVREVAPKHPVLVLGYTQNERLREAAKLGARITVYNWETARALQHLFPERSVTKSKGPSTSSGSKLFVHVKVETGTTRQGIPESEAVKFVKALQKIHGIEVEGISTHFADSEDTRSKYALSQLARYNRIIRGLERAKIAPPIRHMACTAATLRLPQAHGNLVRVGIGLYGLWPSENVKLKMQNVKFSLKPVLTWKTIVAQVKSVKKGTPVSYDRTERVARDSRIAVLPVGYWDGYDRGLSKIGHVLIGGKRCKIVGRICMNMCMADVTDVRGVKSEDEVVLLGNQNREEVSAEEIAEKLSTINYEVVTKINPTLPRIVVQ